jgi:hypothetical protein
MVQKISQSLLLQTGLCFLVILGLFLTSNIFPASAQQPTGNHLEEKQDSSTPSPSPYPPPALTMAATVAPTATETQPSTTYERPLIIIASYNASLDAVGPGDQFTLDVKLANKGQSIANNVVASFTPAELIPLGTGGLIAVGEIAPGNHAHISQELSASYAIWGKTFTSIDMNVSYTDDNGTTYTDKFTITLSVYTPSGSGATATPTITPTSAPILRPQLVISQYAVNVPVLQPGVQFNLELTVENLGNADAKRVTMIFGGGSTSGETGGTPAPGGTSGGGSDLTNFAPLESSNIQALGDLANGATLTVKQSLIVNVSTNPGAYSAKVSFSYLDEHGRNFTDDQVITLLVYATPQVGVEFYRDPGPIYAGQPSPLPIQIVNQGRKTTILGNMHVSAANAQLLNNIILIGALDPGTSFPLDAVLTPNQPGPLDLIITVDYTDDFNQPQVITQTLHVEILEVPLPEPGLNAPGKDGGQVESTPIVEETFLQKAWRLVRGLLGLDSGVAAQSLPGSQQTVPTDTSGKQAPSIQAVPAGRPLKGP